MVGVGVVEGVVEADFVNGSCPRKLFGAIDLLRVGVVVVVSVFR